MVCFDQHVEQTHQLCSLQRFKNADISKDKTIIKKAYNEMLKKETIVHSVIRDYICLKCDINIKLLQHPSLEHVLKI